MEEKKEIGVVENKEIGIVEFLGSLLLVGFFGVAGGVAQYHFSKNYSGRYITNTENVQQGYVVPADLSFRLQDRDNDGANEVFLKYKGNCLGF